MTVTWLVPYTPTFQQYSVIYGLEPGALDNSWGLVYSAPDVSVVNQTFSISVQGLTQGTDYYLRVSSTFGHNVIYSDLVAFTTLDPRETSRLSVPIYSLLTVFFFCCYVAPTGPPLNFTIDVSGTTLDLSWAQPALEQRSGVIRYYTLTCTPEGGQPTVFSLNNVTIFSLDDFLVNTQYTCTLSASTSGGPGPTTSTTATTDAGRSERVQVPETLFNFSSTRCRTRHIPTTHTCGKFA